MTKSTHAQSPLARLDSIVRGLSVRNDALGFWKEVKSQFPIGGAHGDSGLVEFEQQLREAVDVSDNPHQAMDVLGPCWELAKLRVMQREAAQRDCRLERDVANLFESLLEGCADLDRVWSLIDNCNTTAGMAGYRIDLSVRSETGGPIGPEDPFEIRVAADGGQSNEWLYLAIFQRETLDDDKKRHRWTQLFPNQWDFQVPWIVPNMEMCIPEAGYPYQLRAPRSGGDCLLRAFVTPNNLHLPVGYVLGVTNWLGKGTGNIEPMREHFKAKHKQLIRLSTTVKETPGLVSIQDVALM